MDSLNTIQQITCDTNMAGFLKSYAPIIISIIYIFLGWALGFTSTYIMEKRRQQVVCNNFKKVLLNELIELQYHMSMMINLSKLETGDLTEDVVNKTYPILKSYAISRKDDNIMQIAEMSKKLNLKEVQQNALERFNKKLSTGFKSYFAPFLNSQLNNIECLESGMQGKIFNILTFIEQYNQEIDRYWSSHVLTFSPGIETANLGILRQNIQTGVRSLSNIANGIVDDIECVTKELKGSVNE